MTATCCICGNAFEPRNPKRPPKTCSRACTNKMVWRAGRPANCGPEAAPRPVVICAYCKKAFVPRGHLGRALKATYCSRTCIGRAKSRGGLSFDKQGRMWVRLRDASKQQYARCLMEAHLRRHLLSHEHVHHINLDPTDDRLENLEVLTNSEHGKAHAPEAAERRRRASRLTDAMVAEIRRRAGDGERQRVLAREFGVSDAMLSLVVNGKARNAALLKSHGRS